MKMQKYKLSIKSNDYLTDNMENFKIVQSRSNFFTSYLLESGITPSRSFSATAGFFNIKALGPKTAPGLIEVPSPETMIVVALLAA